MLRRKVISSPVILCVLVISCEMPLVADRPSSDVKGFYNLVSRTWRCNRCQQSRLTQQWLRMPVSIRTRQHLGEKSSPVVLPHAQKRQASAYTRSWAQAVPPGSTSHHVYKCLHWGRLARALPTRCSPGAETAAAWQRLRLRLPTPPPYTPRTLPNVSDSQEFLSFGLLGRGEEARSMCTLSSMGKLKI